MQRLVEKSYSGQIFRPRPEIKSANDGQYLIVATPWGPRSSAKKVTQIIEDYLRASQQDLEATAPFEHMSCLSPLANNIRVAIKLANEAIYHDENQKELTSGVELFVLARSADEVAWVQIGHPYAFLVRPHQSPLALGPQHDLSLEFSVSSPLSPLPNKLLGVDSTLNFNVESMRPGENDRLILLARTGMPTEVLQISQKELNVNSISQILSKQNADQPFWLGIYDLKVA